MARWPLWWGAPALAFALPFVILAVRGGGGAILDDDAHHWAPWVLLAAGAAGAGAPFLWKPDHTPGGGGRRAPCWAWAAAALAYAASLLAQGAPALETGPVGAMWQTVWIALMLAVCIAIAVCTHDEADAAEADAVDGDER
ncbi:MAG: hypothetical protein F4Y02_06050 [Chloroflexi bacterium]|nr:hypothetical protein [Chloroflexota bacterium]